MVKERDEAKLAKEAARKAKKKSPITAGKY